MSAFRSAIDELAGEPLAQLNDVALAADLVELRAAIDRLEGEWLRRLAAFDRRRGYAPSGTLSVAGWLRGACRMAPGTARQRVGVAGQLVDLPATAAALCAGKISDPRAAVIAGSTAQVRPELVREAEPTLVAAARSLDLGQLRTVLAHW